MVAEYGISYIEGLHETGTIATLKHFPGHGNTDTDSHTGFPLIDSTYEELKEFELIPFQKTINAGVNLLILPPVFDTEGFRHLDEIIASQHEAGKTVVVISCGLPYDAARFTDADAIVLAYNSSPMKEIPNESGEGSAYAPNLAAALVSCFGGGEALGTLPVSIPEINEDYQITDKI